MIMTGFSIHTRDMFEMVRVANAIGAVYTAATGFHERPTHITALRLLRTKRAARRAGVDHQLIQETTRLAREQTRAWTP